MFGPGARRLLHVAPEPEFERRLRRLPALRYQSLDTQDEGAEHRVDLAATGLDAGQYDMVHCSHVLEHVADDHACISEIYRLLKPGGWATILVPMIAEASHEDPDVKDPKERARLYGQWDHVRAYGPDFIDRLTAAGFSVERVTASDVAGGEERRVRMGLADEQLFFCRKPTQTTAA